MKKQTALLLLCAALMTATTATACGDTAASSGNTTTPVSETTAETEAAVEEVYPYGSEDMGGYTIRIANFDDVWDMYVKLDFAETDGEPLNDAVYNRNRTVEDRLNCTVQEIILSDEHATVNSKIKTAIMAGDDVYDAAYPAIATTPAMVTDGLFLDLAKIPELHLDEPWWDGYVIEQIAIGDRVYFASGALHLMAIDSAWMLYFNESIMQRNDLALPYDDVRNGTWTIEKLLTYTKAVANMNGDADFKWDPDGNAFYGISMHIHAADHFLLGCGETLVDKTGDTFSLAIDDDRFYTALEECAKVMDNTNGYAINADTDDFNRELGGYAYLFANGRALFLTAEIKEAQLLRDMEDTFGIVPFPKLDETQENYRSSFVGQCAYYTIPTTNTHLHETAYISDALSYQSYKDVLPVYAGIRVEQKGLRNEDSIEMLNIVRSTMTTDSGITYQWVESMLSDIRSKLILGNGALSSVLEKKRSSVEKAIAKTTAAAAEME